MFPLEATVHMVVVQWLGRRTAIQTHALKSRLRTTNKFNTKKLSLTKLDIYVDTCLKLGLCVFQH